MALHAYDHDEGLQENDKSGRNQITRIVSRHRGYLVDRTLSRYPCRIPAHPVGSSPYKVPEVYTVAGARHDDVRPSRDMAYHHDEVSQAQRPFACHRK